MLKYVCILAAVAIANGADRMYFNNEKCNNDFDNTRNWGKVKPMGDESPPVRVMFAREDGTAFRPIKTFVPEGEVNLESLNFADDMVRARIHRRN